MDDNYSSSSFGWPTYTVPSVRGVNGYIATYLERDEKEGGYLTKTTPCPFLGADNKCTIYAVRPEKCRGYPFTDKPDFPFMSITHANNAVVCPAVFYIVEQLKKRMGRR